MEIQAKKKKFNESNKFDNDAVYIYIHAQLASVLKQFLYPDLNEIKYVNDVLFVFQKLYV